MTLPSLTLLSYTATLIRPGASTAFAAVGTLAIGVRLALAAEAGRGLPLGTLAALVVVPVLVTGGGFFAVRRGYNRSKTVAGGCIVASRVLALVFMAGRMRSIKNGATSRR